MRQLIWIPIISLLLEMILSCFIPIDTALFNCLFTLTSLIIICPYFSSRANTYYKTCLLVGFLYDVIINNTIFLNTIIFLTMGIIAYYIYQMISNHIITSSISIIVIIIIYRLLSYVILLFIGYLKWDLGTLLHSITSSLLLNIIYSIFLYYIVRFFAKKLKIIKLY